jgi:hypothetical protein
MVTGSAQEEHGMDVVEQPRSGALSRPLSVWLCTGLAVVLGFCVLRLLVFRPAVDVNTFFPERGLAMAEMRARYGPPSEVHPGGNGKMNWFYYTDGFGLGISAVGVEFDADGRVTGSWNQ